MHIYRGCLNFFKKLQITKSRFKYKDTWKEASPRSAQGLFVHQAFLFITCELFQLLRYLLWDFMKIYSQDLCDLQAENIFETACSILQHRDTVQNQNRLQNGLDALKQHRYWHCTSKAAYYMPRSRLGTLFKLPLRTQINKPSAL